MWNIVTNGPRDTLKTSKVHRDLWNILISSQTLEPPVKDEKTGEDVYAERPSFDKAVEQAKGLLDGAEDGLYSLLLNEDGAKLRTIDPPMSPEEHAKREEAMEALRVYNSTEEQIKRGYITAEEAKIRDDIINKYAVNSAAEDGTKPYRTAEQVGKEIGEAINKHRYAKRDAELKAEAEARAQAEAEEKIKIEMVKQTPTTDEQKPEGVK